MNSNSISLTYRKLARLLVPAFACVVYLAITCGLVTAQHAVVETTAESDLMELKKLLPEESKVYQKNSGTSAATATYSVALQSAAKDSISKIANSRFSQQVVSLYIYPACELTGIGEEIEKLETLTTLAIWKVKDAWPKGLAASIAKLKRLETLRLSDTGVSGEDFRVLSDLKTLKVLALDGTTLTGKDLQVIGKLQNLEGLILSDLKIDGNEFRFLENLQSLRILNISRTGFSSESFEYIVKCKNLSIVSLTRTNITFKEFNALKGLMGDVLLEHHVFSEPPIPFSK